MAGGHRVSGALGEARGDGVNEERGFHSFVLWVPVSHFKLQDKTGSQTMSN